MSGRIVLVFGGRDFADVDLMFDVLDGVHADRPIRLLIEGGASGADSLARKWADLRDVANLTVFAQWARYGTSGGPRRNENMIRARPDLAVGFPGGKGTAHMGSLCEKHGVKLLRVEAR